MEKMWGPKKLCFILVCYLFEVEVGVASLRLGSLRSCLDFSSSEIAMSTFLTLLFSATDDSSLKSHYWDTKEKCEIFNFRRTKSCINIQSNRDLIELSKSGGRQPDTPSPQPSQTWGKAKTLSLHTLSAQGNRARSLLRDPVVWLRSRWATDSLYL